MNTPTILAMNIQPEKLGKLRFLCLRLGIRVQIVEQRSFGCAVGDLAAGSAAPVRGKWAPFADEMLVMASFRPGMLDAFLGGFREMGIAPVALKAMLTETNASWTLERLHAALREEHEQMEAFRRQRGAGK